MIVGETGVSAEYANEYNGKITFLSIGDQDAETVGLPSDFVNRVAALFTRYPVKKYRERFPLTEFEDVVNNKNREAVSRLDEIAEEANTRFIDPSEFTEDDFKRKINEVYTLVYGENRPRFYPLSPEI